MIIGFSELYKNFTSICFAVSQKNLLLSFENWASPVFGFPQQLVFPHTYLHDLLENDDIFNDPLESRALRMNRHNFASHLTRTGLGRGHTQNVDKENVGRKVRLGVL